LSVSNGDGRDTKRKTPKSRWTCFAIFAVNFLLVPTKFVRDRAIELIGLREMSFNDLLRTIPEVAITSGANVAEQNNVDDT
jgi:hypothetical protein